MYYSGRDRPYTVRVSTRRESQEQEGGKAWNQAGISQPTQRTPATRVSCEAMKQAQAPPAGTRPRQGDGHVRDVGSLLAHLGAGRAVWGEQRSGRRLWRIAQSQTGHGKPSVSVLDLEGEGKLPAVSPGLGKTSTATESWGRCHREGGPGHAGSDRPLGRDIYRSGDRAAPGT